MERRWNGWKEKRVDKAKRSRRRRKGRRKRRSSKSNWSSCKRIEGIGKGRKDVERKIRKQ